MNSIHNRALHWTPMPLRSIATCCESYRWGDNTFDKWCRKTKDSKLKKPDTPENEQRRLAKLSSLAILDTPPEERFDRLTRIAKRLFRVPIAVVGLIDENRQWFKSCTGLDFRQTSRDISFCGHAILSDEIFVIPNAAEDGRFADNPVVENEPHIRFYAGCPLKANDGSKLGSLCIMDREPRTLGQEDLEALADLASIVERELSVFQLAITDELTNISNRRGFMLLAQHCMSFCAREKIPLTLVFIDLNDFKSINDRLGHSEGDRALTFFAGQLKNTFRDSDIIARLGGDEFVVLLTDHTRDVIERTIGRLRLSIDNFNREAKRDYNISFSYGVVEFNPDVHNTVETLLSESETLMYKDKESGQ